jgi:hypothetical protein
VGNRLQVIVVEQKDFFYGRITDFKQEMAVFIFHCGQTSMSILVSKQVSKVSE